MTKTTLTWDEYEAMETLNLPPITVILTPVSTEEDEDPPARYLLQDDTRAILAETTEDGVVLTDLTPDEVKELLDDE